MSSRLRKNIYQPNRWSKLLCAAALTMTIITLNKYFNVYRGTASIRQFGTNRMEGIQTGAFTSTGRQKERNEKAFVLSVELLFEDKDTATQVIDEWRKVAEWCHNNEAILYHYEIAKSDQDPLKYHMYERYRSKSDYLNIHKASDAFQEFRKILQEAQDRGAVKVSGSSYLELGIGYV